jgi:hypothetical protein
MYLRAIYGLIPVTTASAGLCENRVRPGGSWTRLTTAGRVIGETLRAEQALGSECFKDEIEAALHRKVRPSKAGRPKSARLISWKVQSDPEVSPQIKLFYQPVIKKRNLHDV